MPAETTSIMVHTYNSGKRGVPSNRQSIYTTPISFAAVAGDIIESNQAMFTAFTEVLQTTYTFMGTQLHEHSKYQMEQVNKLIKTATQMTSSHSANKLAASDTDDPENSDNSDSGKGVDVNDGRNRVTINEKDRSLCNGTDLPASFLFHQKTSLSSVATTGEPENYPMMDSVFKEFSESFNLANENWGEPTSEEATKAASVVFK